MSEMIDILKSVSFDTLCTVYRSEIDDINISGFPVFCNSKWLTLHYAYDFELNGYKIIRLQDITKCEYNSETMRFFNSLYRKENIAPALPNQISLSGTIQDIFIQLKNNKIVCSVEREYSGYAFDIGKVERVSETSIDMRCFDVLCNLDDNVTTIMIEDITTISFGDRYTEIMGKSAFSK